MAVWIWLGFFAFILAMLALDIGVFHRKPKEESTGEALAWTAYWIAIALVFNVGVYFIYEHRLLGIDDIGGQLTGTQAAIQFFTGYLIEKSLSLDNIFVIALIFTYFRVPLAYQHRVLYWGVLGAIVLRGAMIALGAVLIKNFSWTMYLFGLLLIFTAVKMMVARHDNLRPDKNPIIKLARRFMPVATEYDGVKFFTTVDGKRAITPLFLALLMVESMDVMFAVDSVPAIFAVTQDTFIVFTSNVFAIFGLRSLYFALAAVMERFHYMKASLVFLLAFVGVKMILAQHYHIPTAVSLAVIVGIISVGALASVVGPGRRETGPHVSPFPDEVTAMAEVTYHGVRKIAVLVIGTSVVLIGVVMIFTPGPAIVVIPMGFAILATEFLWARRILKKIEKKARETAKSLSKKKE